MAMPDFRKWIQPAVMALPSKRKIALGFLLLLLFLSVVSPLFNQWMYPLKYEEHIFYSAEATGADPFLVMAIIRVESKFEPQKQSPKGAQGLMQLMPETVDWIISEGKFSPAFRDLVYDPQVNIHMGSWYISGLVREFQGNKIAAIAAYNAGPGNVKRWLKEGKWDGSRRKLNAVPYGETRHYIRRVTFFYEKYRTLYGHLTESEEAYTLPQ